MKKVLISIVCVAVLAALYACSSTGDLNTDQGSSEGGQGITVNEIPFERVTADALPGDLKDKIEQSREEEGFDILMSGEASYLVVYAGERPTAGYSIEITRIVDQEGVTQVTVKETVPGEDEMVAQVITYPVDIAKLGMGISGNVELSFIKDGDA
jgi:hypothetical protein